MVTFYLVCAAVGGIVLIIQFVLSLIGLAGEHDVGVDHVDVGVDHVDFGVDHVDVGDHFDAGHHDLADHHDMHDASWFFSVLSFRSLVAAVAFFGLGGLGATSADLSFVPSLLVAFGAGAVAMIIVAWLMNLLYSLGAEGTVHIEKTVDQAATVYLGIPPNRQGTGKVTVKVQNRTMEYLAVTSGHQELPSGSQVRIVRVVSPNTVEVEALSE